MNWVLHWSLDGIAVVFVFVLVFAQSALAKKDTRPVDDYEPVPGYTLSCTSVIDESERKTRGAKTCYLADENGEMVDMDAVLQSYNWSSSLPEDSDVDIENLDPVAGEFHYGYMFEADDAGMVKNAIDKTIIVLNIIGHDDKAETVHEDGMANKQNFGNIGGKILDRIFNNDEGENSQE